MAKRVLLVLISTVLAFSLASDPVWARALEEGGQEEAAIGGERLDAEGVGSPKEDSSLDGVSAEEPAEPLSEPMAPSDDGVSDEIRTRIDIPDEPVDALVLTAQSESNLPTPANNAWFNDYAIWMRRSVSFLHISPFGLERVEYVDHHLLVERLTEDYSTVVSSHVVDSSTYRPSTLTADEDFRWGGFFSGAEHNYVVTGQTNDDENNDIAVFRITKYSKTWDYVGSVELYGANTTIPFEAGSCEMVETDGMLHVRTAHKMYTSYDGLRHQMNAHIIIHEADMVVVDEYMDYVDIARNNCFGFVSHSFAQYLAVTSDNTVFCLDQGDANPRAIRINRINDTNVPSYGDVIEFSGENGENYTGASVGGFEYSSTSGMLLSVGNIANQDTYSREMDNSCARNVWLAATPTSNLPSSSVRYLTSYTSDGSVTATTPQLVKVNENRFLVLWGTKTLASVELGSLHDIVYYQFVDGYGNPLGPTQNAKAKLSDCQPIICDDKIVWFAGDTAYTGYMLAKGVMLDFYEIGAWDGSFRGFENKVRTTTSWRRLSGENRYDTMATIGYEGFSSYNWAVLATGEDFPDALAASALAGVRKCPVALTVRNGITFTTMGLIWTREVKNVYIMGGTNALNGMVDDTLASVNIATTRIAGASRIETSIAAMQTVRAAGSTSDTVIVATGKNYPDTLSIGPWSWATASPILLTQDNGELTEAEYAAIRADGKVRQVVIVGGTAAVAESTETRLRDMGLSVTRLAGSDRYETSVAIANWEVSHGLSWKKVAVATGRNFPDALSGAAFVGKKGGVLLLADSPDDPTVAALAAAKFELEDCYFLGGTGAVSEELADTITSATTN